MRRIVAVCVVLAVGCSTSKRWIVADPRSASDGGEVFIKVQSNAIHLRSTHWQGSLLVGDVVSVWVVPAGAGNIPATDASPESLANDAGWPRSSTMPARISVDLAQIESALIRVDVQEGSSGGPSVGVIVVALLLVGLPLLIIETCSEKPCFGVHK